MTESPLSPLIKTARDYLAAAGTQLRHDQPVQQAVGYGVRLLTQVLDEVRTELDGYELAELTAVYDTLAIQLAEALDLDAAAAFLALAEFCGDQNAVRLVHGQPAPTPGQLRLLRSRLLWITVTYEAPTGEPSKRVTEISYVNASGALRSAAATVEFGYEDLPDRVRRRMIATGQEAVRYQLYPASNPAVAAGRA